MQYNSLYRTHRPKTFDDIIGQDHIVKALKNQVASNRVGHAYMFSGSRGIGKTSAALVLAKAINCLAPEDGNPCLKCSACLDNASLDIIEMDAASNNSVDDIRDLREHVKFAPSSGKKKIYIIDEVHMLSTGAFNALLKTLEEPPGYIVFILATTETHKVPATIQSRCQRFEFRRISPPNIAHALRKILEDLGIQPEEEAIRMIIRVSDGSMRDSLAALEQCLSIDNKTFTASGISDVLGISLNMELLENIALLISGKPGRLLANLEHAFDSGREVVELSNSLIEICRDLLVQKVAPDASEGILYGSDEFLARLKQIADSASFDTISAVFESLVELSKTLKYSKNQRAMLEVTLLRHALAENPLLNSKVNKLPESLPPASVTKLSPADREIKKPAITENISPSKPDVNPVNSAKTAEKKTESPANNFNGDDVIAKVIATLGEAEQMMFKDATFGIIAEGEFIIEMPGMQDLRRTAIEISAREPFEKAIKEITGKSYKMKLVSVERATAPAEEHVGDVESYFKSLGVETTIIEE